MLNSDHPKTSQPRPPCRPWAFEQFAHGSTAGRGAGRYALLAGTGAGRHRPVELPQRQRQEPATPAVEDAVVLVRIPHLVTQKEHQAATVLDTVLQRGDRTRARGRHVAQQNAIESVEGGGFDLAGVNCPHLDA